MAELAVTRWSQKPVEETPLSGFESQRAYHVSPSSSAVRTSPFQGGNAGSSPAGDTNLFDLFIEKKE